MIQYKPVFSEFQQLNVNKKVAKTTDGQKQTKGFEPADTGKKSGCQGNKSQNNQRGYACSPVMFNPDGLPAMTIKCANICIKAEGHGSEAVGGIKSKYYSMDQLMNNDGQDN